MLALPADLTIAPHGAPAIIRTYGNPLDYVESKPAWEHLALEVRPLPFLLPYAYGPALISRVRAHRLIVDRLRDLLVTCADRGVQLDRMAYGGCYMYRAQRLAAKLSTHAWGIALDLDPANNELGIPWDGGKIMLSSLIVETFEEAGWTWGGRWERPDCMHMQFAAGY